MIGHPDDGEQHEQQDTGRGGQALVAAGCRREQA